MLEGECLKVRITSCLDCEEELKLDVQRSAAGYYLGFFCNTCGP